MRTRVLPKSELVDWVRTQPPSLAIGMLLAGDRLSCCDEAVAVEEGGQIVSVATIAPKGEQMSGQPTIVALYTPPEFRRKGYGKAVFLGAIKRCRARGFKRVRIDAMSNYVVRIIDSLIQKDRNYLDVHDYGGIMDSIP